MKQGLQYLYSISVFAGVLATAYLLMNKDRDILVPQRGVQVQNLRYEASNLDASVNQLFQTENELSKLPTKSPEQRSPTDTKIKK